MNHRGLKAAVRRSPQNSRTRKALLSFVSCAKARESRSIYAVRKITSPWLMHKGDVLPVHEFAANSSHRGSCTNSKARGIQGIPAQGFSESFATLLEPKHEVSLG